MESSGPRCWTTSIRVKWNVCRRVKSSIQSSVSRYCTHYSSSYSTFSVALLLSHISCTQKCLDPTKQRKDEANSFNQFSLAVLCGSDSLISVFRNFCSLLVDSEHRARVECLFSFWLMLVVDTHWKWWKIKGSNRARVFYHFSCRPCYRRPQYIFSLCCSRRTAIHSHDWSAERECVVANFFLLRFHFCCYARVRKHTALRQPLTCTGAPHHPTRKHWQFFRAEHLRCMCRINCLPVEIAFRVM